MAVVTYLHFLLYESVSCQVLKSNCAGEITKTLNVSLLSQNDESSGGDPLYYLKLCVVLLLRTGVSLITRRTTRSVPQKIFSSC